MQSGRSQISDLRQFVVEGPIDIYSNRGREASMEAERLPDEKV